MKKDKIIEETIELQDLGRLIMKSVGVARMMGHVSPFGSIKDYFHTKNKTEEYFRDWVILCGSRGSSKDLDEFIEKYKNPLIGEFTPQAPPEEK